MQHRLRGYDHINAYKKHHIFQKVNVDVSNVLLYNDISVQTLATDYEAYRDTSLEMLKA